MLSEANFALGETPGYDLGMFGINTRTAGSLWLLVPVGGGWNGELPQFHWLHDRIQEP